MPVNMPREVLYTFRHKRGMELAATRTIRKKGNVWIVPSQIGAGVYTVDLGGAQPTCTCSDYRKHPCTCKHIFAAAYKAGTVKDLVVTRPLYRQNWPAYNAAQAVEKEMFGILLADLCAGIPPALPPKTGRPPLSQPDAVFTAALKVYSTRSARRFDTELREAHEAGFVSRVARQATIHNILGNDALTPILRSLVERSALPLVPIEHVFAADSSGLKTTLLVQGVDKDGNTSIDHAHVKCHIMCGIKTNIVTAIEIDEPNAYDGDFLPPLLKTTQRHFTVTEVLADKGYSSKRNLEFVGKAGAVPFIAFQENATGKGGGMWSKMYAYFTYHQEEYRDHYNKRSNVEATFSMVKRKFGKFLRSRNETALKNEALCKFLCHNIVVLIHEMHELGIAPDFISPEGARPRPLLQSGSLHAL